MKRGDIITIAAPGDYGKPRPAVVVQSDHLIGADSVIVCPITTTLRDADLFRLEIPAAVETGLVQTSFVMIEKVTALAARRCRAVIGRLDGASMTRLDQRLAFCLGLADARS